MAENIAARQLFCEPARRSLNALPHKMASSSEPKRAAASRPLIAWLADHEMLEMPEPTADHEMLETPEPTPGKIREAMFAAANRAAFDDDFATLSFLADHGMTPKMYALVVKRLFRRGGRSVEMFMDWFDARVPMTSVMPHIGGRAARIILRYPSFRKFYVRYASPEIDSCLLLFALRKHRARSVEIFKRNCLYGIVTRAACLARGGIVLYETSRWRGARRHVFGELIRCCRLSPADLASVGLKWPKT